MANYLSWQANVWAPLTKYDDFIDVYVSKITSEPYNQQDFAEWKQYISALSDAEQVSVHSYPLGECQCLEFWLELMSPFSSILKLDIWTRMVAFCVRVVARGACWMADTTTTFAPLYHHHYHHQLMESEYHQVQSSIPGAKWLFFPPPSIYWNHQICMMIPGSTIATRNSQFSLNNDELRPLECSPLEPPLLFVIRKVSVCVTEVVGKGVSIPWELVHS